MSKTAVLNFISAFLSTCITGILSKNILLNSLVPPNNSGKDSLKQYLNNDELKNAVNCKYHKKYPYLLRNKVIRYPNQVWSTDITYIKLPTGNVYLMAIIDWFSRKVLSWCVFNTMDALQYANLLRETSKNTAALQSSIQTREASLHLS